MTSRYFGLNQLNSTQFKRSLAKSKWEERSHSSPIFCKANFRMKARTISFFILEEASNLKRLGKNPCWAILTPNHTRSKIYTVTNPRTTTLKRSPRVNTQSSRKITTAISFLRSSQSRSASPELKMQVSPEILLLCETAGGSFLERIANTKGHSKEKRFKM